MRVEPGAPSAGTSCTFQFRRRPAVVWSRPHLLIDRYSCTLHAMWGVRARAGRASGRVLEGMAGTDFRARLGVSLTQALVELNSRRQEAALSTAVAAVPPAAQRRPVLRHAFRFRKPIAIGVALLTVGGAGAAASSLWLSPAGNPLYGFNPGLTESSPPAAQLAALAVLRRAQTPADRGPGVQAALTDVNNFTTGIRSNYVRVLGTTSGGPVVLVPVQTRNAAAGQPAIQNALCVYYPAERGRATVQPNQIELLEHGAGARRSGLRGPRHTRIRRGARRRDLGQRLAGIVGAIRPGHGKLLRRLAAGRRRREPADESPRHAGRHALARLISRPAGGGKAPSTLPSSLSRG